MLIFGTSAKAQLRPLEDQYLLNGLAINPAYSGSEELLSITLLNRNQWVGLKGAPSTMTMAMHAPLLNNKFAVGLMVTNDRVGFYNETEILGNYAFRFKVGSGKLSLGLAAGIHLLYDDKSAINPLDADDELLSRTNVNHLLPNFSFGTYYYSEKFFAGFSMPTFLTRKFDDVNGKYKVSGDFKNANYLFTTGYTFGINENFKILPSSLVRVNPQSATQADFNLNLIFGDKFWIGSSYRTSKTVIWLLQYQINRQFRVAYSYGTDFSELVTYRNGSHEIMIKYNFDYIMDILSPRSF